MHMVITEQGCFPATEAVKRHRDRNRHVHADHAHLDFTPEISRSAAVSGEDGNTVPKFVSIYEVHRRLVISSSNDGQNRTEYLLLIDAHLRRYAIEQRAAYKEAVLVTLQPELPSIDDKFSAFLDAYVHIGANFVQVLASN